MHFEISIILLLAGVHSGFAIRCFVCNSRYEDNCLDPFDEALARSGGMLKDCDAVAESEASDKEGVPQTKFTHCRKLLQTVESDFRMIRSCATLAKGENTRVNSATDYYKKTDITCKGEACNGVPMLKADFATMISVILMTLTAFRRN